ncbi:MAG: LysE family translocator [Haloarculaceae archaeon]
MAVLALLTTLLAGVVFGLALAAPPGPMNAVIAEESVLRGWNAGFRAGLGAAVADFTFFLLSLAGVVTFVRELPRLRAAMIAVGGLLMCYFAYGAARAAGGSFLDTGAGARATDGGARDARAPSGVDAAPDAAGDSRGFRKAFVLALTNPYQILFWLTVGVGLLRPGRVDVLAYAHDALAGLLVVTTGSPALLVGLFGGIAVWIVGFPAALVAAERRVNAVAPAVAYGSALVLAGTGIYLLADAAGTLAALA